MRKMRKRRFGGNSSPDGWEPPRGGAWARGANGKPYRPEGRIGLTGRARGRGGGRQAASKQRASKKANGWVLPRGAHGQGVRTASPFRPEGRMGLTGRAPGWGGGKLQQARLLCPRCAGAKGVGLVDMRY